MPATTTSQEIEELKRRLETLSEQAENELRQRLAEARRVVEELERQLSDVTGRPSASEIRAQAAEAKGTRTRRNSISDEELQSLVLQVLAATNQNGINAKQIATALQQSPARIRQFILANPRVLKRVGSGPGTKFFLP